MIKDFVSISDFDGPQLLAMIKRAIADKKAFRAGRLKPTLTR